MIFWRWSDKQKAARPTREVHLSSVCTCTVLLGSNIMRSFQRLGFYQRYGALVSILALLPFCTQAVSCQTLSDSK